MKKLGALLLVLSLIFSSISQTVFATAITSVDQDLTSYLEEASTIRGFAVTPENVDEALATFGLTASDFNTVAEIKSVLGDVIKADLSNLNNIYSDYDLDQTGLTQLLGEYGEELNDYIFLNDLDMDLYFYTDSSEGEVVPGTGAFPMIDKAMIFEMLDQIGLSEEELTNIQQHYISIMEGLSSTEVQSQLEELNLRTMVLIESINAKVAKNVDYQPSQEELSELSSVYEEILSIFQLKLVTSIIKNGVETPLTFAELLRLSDLKDADIKILIYDLNSVLLAEAVIPSELINSELDKLVSNNEETSENDTIETEKGGKLPKTAANYIPNAFIGILIALAGILVYRKVRLDKGEVLEK